MKLDLNRRIRTYSTGMKQKLALAQVFADPVEHLDPGRADFGPGSFGPGYRPGPGRRRTAAGPDGDLLRSCAGGSGAGRRPGRDHAQGAADACGGHACPPQPSDGPGSLRAGDRAGAARGTGTDRAGTERRHAVARASRRARPAAPLARIGPVADVAIGTEDLRSLYDQFHGPNVPDEEVPA